MPVWIVTGKLGGGKSKISVSRIKLYLDRGAPVATNMDIYLEPMYHRNARNVQLIRVNDTPDLHDLESLGYANFTADEEKNGLLVLDECGSWFNSRNWNDKTRSAVNDWFRHARKYGWDVILIVQDIELLDSQARKAIAEHTVFCKRLDRFSIPYLSPLWKLLTGSRLPGPKVHTGRVVYGTTDSDILVERWVSTGSTLHKCYNTKQIFRSERAFEGPFCQLTPWHLKGRYFKWTLEKIMQASRVFTRRMRTTITLTTGVMVGMLGSLVAAPYMLASMQERAQLLEPVVQPVVAEQPPGQQQDILSFDSEEEIAAEKPLTLEQRFASFTIVAFVDSGARKHYQVQSPEGNSFTDQQLRAMGYVVMPVSECELLVGSLDGLREKVSIFAPGCVERAGREQLDLASMPYFANKQVAADQLTLTSSNVKTLSAP